MADPRVARVGKAIRAARGTMSRRELGRRANYDHTLIRKLEEATRAKMPDEEVIARIDAALEQDGRILRLAGFHNADPDISDALKLVVDQHIARMAENIRALVEDIDALKGR